MIKLIVAIVISGGIGFLMGAVLAAYGAEIKKNEERERENDETIRNQ